RYNSVTELETALSECLNPDKLNETVYQSPSHIGEETKAIPLYNQFEGIDDLEKTLLSNNDETTKNLSPVKKSNKKPKSKKIWKKVLLISLIIAFILGLGIGAFILLKPKNVNIPDVTGLEFEEAREEIEALNLKTDRKSINSRSEEHTTELQSHLELVCRLLLEKK